MIRLVPLTFYQDLYIYIYILFLFHNVCIPTIRANQVSVQSRFTHIIRWTLYNMSVIRPKWNEEGSSLCDFSAACAPCAYRTESLQKVWREQKLLCWGRHLRVTHSPQWPKWPQWPHSRPRHSRNSRTHYI